MIGRRLRVAAAGALLVCCTTTARAAVEPADVRRAFALLGGMQQEYSEAVDDAGQVVRPRELAEARLLLGDLRDISKRLGADAPGFTDGVAAIAADVGASRPAAIVIARIAALRQTLSHATGANEDVLPPQLPSAERGARVFADNCAPCHGDRGAGDGPSGAGLAQRPADFTDLGFMRSETPIDFFRVVSLGRRTAGMPAWEDALTLQERWDVVSYAYSLALGPGSVDDGARLFAIHCASCHDGGERGTTLTSLATLGLRTDADLFATISDGVGADRMPGCRRELSDTDRWHLVAAVRQRSLGVIAAGDGRTTPPGVAFARALERVRRGVGAAVNAYRLGDDGATGQAAEAYLLFEPLEPGIAERDPAAVTQVEGAFQRLRTALRLPGAVTEVEAAAAAVDRALTAVPAPRDGDGAGVLLAAVVIVSAIALAAWRRSRPPSSPTRPG